MRRSRTIRTTTSRRLLRGVAITVCMVLASLPVPAQESWLEAAGDTARCGAQGAQETEKAAKQAERHVTRATMLSSRAKGNHMMVVVLAGVMMSSLLQAAVDSRIPLEIRV